MLKRSFGIHLFITFMLGVAGGYLLAQSALFFTILGVLAIIAGMLNILCGYDI